jgi:hypothetical protein
VLADARSAAVPPIANDETTRRAGRAHRGQLLLRFASLTGARISKVILHPSQLHS